MTSSKIKIKLLPPISTTKEEEQCLMGSLGAEAANKRDTFVELSWVSFSCHFNVISIKVYHWSLIKKLIKNQYVHAHASVTMCKINKLR